MGRTSKNIKLRIPEKPHKIKGFRSGSYRVATTISSQPRYDRFDTAAYLIFKHRPARHLEKCKISMQDNKGKFRCAPEEKPAVKPFLADKLTKGRESFESRLFDHLSTAPYSILTARPAGPLEKCKISMQDTSGNFRRTPCFLPRVKPNPADKSAREPQTFESRLFDHLSTAPYSPAHKRAILYYNRFGGPRQRETRSKRAVGQREGAQACAAPAAPAGRPGGAGERPCFPLRLSGRALPFSPPRAGVSGPFAVQPFAAGDSLPSARSWRVMPSK